MTSDIDRPQQPRFRFQHSSLLGTVVELSFELAGPDGADRAELISDALFAEVARLQAVFSAFDEESELCRWRRGDRDLGQPSAEFCSLMADTLWWQHRTAGLFNPLAGELTRLWEVAERPDGAAREPDPEILAATAASIAQPRFEIIDGRPVPIGDCSNLNLNAMAKGHIVDRVVAIGTEHFAIDNLLINAGGDLRHAGSGPVRIGIENPHRPYDNEPPLIIIEIANEAVAGSGSSRQGFNVGGDRLNHVLDPRSGRPAAGSASVNVVADSAQVADVVATTASILAPADAVALIDDLDGSSTGTETRIIGDIAGLVIGHDGKRHPSRRWNQRFGP